MKRTFFKKDYNLHESKLLCELKQPVVSKDKQGIYFEPAALLRAHHRFRLSLLHSLGHLGTGS